MFFLKLLWDPKKKVNSIALSPICCMMTQLMLCVGAENAGAEPLEAARGGGAAAASRASAPKHRPAGGEDREHVQGAGRRDTSRPWLRHLRQGRLQGLW